MKRYEQGDYDGVLTPKQRKAAATIFGQRKPRYETPADKPTQADFDVLARAEARMSRKAPNTQEPDLTYIQPKFKAYVAVIRADGQYGLGIAVEGEGGYYATSYESVDSMAKAQAWADEGNKRMGVTPNRAAEIIASTIAAQHAGRR